MNKNLRVHEVIGLILIFLGTTCLGIGLYITIYVGVGQFMGEVELRGIDYLLFPLFFGVGSLLYSLGKIELKGVVPGR